MQIQSETSWEHVSIFLGVAMQMANLRYSAQNQVCFFLKKYINIIKIVSWDRILFPHVWLTLTHASTNLSFSALDPAGFQITQKVSNLSPELGTLVG